MAADKEELTRKPWTAIVLTCQNKASAHTFQKGRQFTYAYVSAFNGVNCVSHLIANPFVSQMFL